MLLLGPPIRHNPPRISLCMEGVSWNIGLRWTLADAGNNESPFCREAFTVLHAWGLILSLDGRTCTDDGFVLGLA